MLYWEIILGLTQGNRWYILNNLLYCCGPQIMVRPILLSLQFHNPKRIKIWLMSQRETTPEGRQNPKRRVDLSNNNTVFQEKTISIELCSFWLCRCGQNHTVLCWGQESDIDNSPISQEASKKTWCLVYNQNPISWLSKQNQKLVTHLTQNKFTSISCTKLM